MRSEPRPRPAWRLPRRKREPARLGAVAEDPPARSSPRGYQPYWKPSQLARSPTNAATRTTMTMTARRRVFHWSIGFLPPRDADELGEFSAFWGAAGSTR